MVEIKFLKDIWKTCKTQEMANTASVKVHVKSLSTARVHSRLHEGRWTRRRLHRGPIQWRWQGPGRVPSGRQASFSQCCRLLAFPTSPRASRVRARTNLSETAGVPPRPASPRLTLEGRGGTNQRATSPFRFEAPDARLTPRAPRALIGCACRRSGREAGRAEGKGRRWPASPRAPLSPGPFPRRSASFLSSSVPFFRARPALRWAGVPRTLTGVWGRQSAGGSVPAPGLRRRIGGARGPGWEAGLPRGRGGGGAPRQSAASERRASHSEVGALRPAAETEGGSGG
ncbi:uncharacterized protein LOC110343991 [Heterocephalus glaber]|uniref:Uncharacterized protein LOC110343991 n=1 Tax=Heterocephalus glaber TaxID=10181 RepID=A0AAX6R6H0_HETGA|nr:uncharacterized protein LOC110343991 [Heterocephalus glaber]